MMTVIVSCQNGSNNSGNSGNNNQTNPAMNNVCLNNPAACQNQTYQQGQGFSPYNTSYDPYGYNQGGYNNGFPGSYYNGSFHTNNGSYLCNCPTGTVPTYNDYGGLGCVQANYAQASGYGYAYFGFGTGNTSINNQWVNIPQISNYTGYNQSNCYNGVVQSCFVDQANTCTQGYSCKATTAQSRLGLCVSNTTQQTQSGPR